MRLIPVRLDGAPIPLVQLAFPMPHMIRLKSTHQAWEARVTGADQTLMAKRADALGYDMISVPEHFLIPHEHVELSGPHYFNAGVTMSAVPIPPMPDVSAYLDYAQWVIEEVKPNVPATG